MLFKNKHQGNNIRRWNHCGESTIILGQKVVMRHWGNCSTNIVRRSQIGLIFEDGKNIGFARWLDLVCESKRGIRDDLKCWFIQLNSFAVWLFQALFLVAICKISPNPQKQCVLLTLCWVSCLAWSCHLILSLNEWV